MDSNELKAGVIIRGPRLPEPIQVLAVTRLGDMFKVDGRGLQTNQFHQRVVPPAQIADLTALPVDNLFDGGFALLAAIPTATPQTSCSPLAR